MFLSPATLKRREVFMRLIDRDRDVIAEDVAFSRLGLGQGPLGSQSPRGSPRINKEVDEYGNESEMPRLHLTKPEFEPYMFSDENI